MAIATLARCYNNPGVFSGVVKIRRGESVQLIMRAKDMQALRDIFHEHLSLIEAQMPLVESSTHETAELIAQVRKQAGLPGPRRRAALFRSPDVLAVALVLLAAACAVYAGRLSLRR